MTAASNANDGRNRYEGDAAISTNGGCNDTNSVHALLQSPGMLCFALLQCPACWAQNPGMLCSQPGRRAAAGGRTHGRGIEPERVHQRSKPFLHHNAVLCQQQVAVKEAALGALQAPGFLSEACSGFRADHALVLEQSMPLFWSKARPGVRAKHARVLKQSMRRCGVFAVLPPASRQGHLNRRGTKWNRRCMDVNRRGTEVNRRCIEACRHGTESNRH